MQTNNSNSAQPFARLQITVYGFEAETEDFTGAVHVSIFVDKAKVMDAELDSIMDIPLAQDCDCFQMQITDSESGQSLGSLSMRLDEIYRLKPQIRKHWVTLFEDPEDDIYDGDYMEDDADVPRILVSYMVQKVITAPEPAALPQIEPMKNETKNESKGMVQTVVDPHEPATKFVPAEKTEENQKVVVEIDQPQRLEQDSLMNPEDIPAETTELDAEIIEAVQEIKEETVKIEPKIDAVQTKLEEITPVPAAAAEPDLSSTNQQLLPEATKDLIVVLTEQNKKLRDEVHALEDSKSALLAKLQAEVQDYDARISGLLKEKFELKERLSATEQALSLSQKTAGEASAELGRAQSKLAEEIRARDTQMEERISHYEEFIQELKQDNEKRLEQTTATKSVEHEDYLKKLAELETNFTNQIKALQEKLAESDTKRAETLAELQRKTESETALAEKVRTLEHENHALARSCDYFENESKAAAEKLKQAEARMVEAERKGHAELAGLQDKNIALASMVEQLNANLSQMKCEKENCESILSAKDSEMTALKTQMKHEIETVKSVAAAETQVWESEKTHFVEMVSSKDAEIVGLQKALNNANGKLLKKSHVEDELSEKLRVIRSLETIIEELKAIIESLKKKNADLETELSAAKNGHHGAQTEIENLERKIAIRDQKVAALTSELAGTITNLQKAQAQLAERDMNSKVHQTEIEALKSQLQEKTIQMAEYETEQKKRAERLDDIAQKTKETEKEIENLRLRSKNKEEKLQEASIKLIQKSKQLREMEAQLYQLQEELSAVKGNLKRETDENDTLRKDAIQYKKEIEDLKALIETYKHITGDEESKDCHIIYTPDNTDKVDQMFAFYINETKCPVKLKKVGEGQYMFGTKKIFAKIQNEKLVIRVGGGYMMIDEFLSVYTAQELSKLQRAAVASENESEDSASVHKGPGSFVKPAGKEVVIEGDVESESDPHAAMGTSRKKSDSHMVFLKSTNKDVAEKGRMPGGVTMRSKSPTAGLINGTNRTRVLTEQDVANIKTVKGGTGKVEVKILVKKNSSAVAAAATGEETENDSTLAKKVQEFNC